MTDTTPPQCPDCQQAMELGFVPMYVNASDRQLAWHPGEPQFFKFLGRATRNIKTDPDKLRPIQSYRCPKCGLLRIYAP